MRDDQTVQHYVLCARSSTLSDVWALFKVYVELVENYRFKDSRTSLHAKFLQGARVGDPDPDLLVEVNFKCCVRSTV